VKTLLASGRERPLFVPRVCSKDHSSCHVSGVRPVRYDACRPEASCAIPTRVYEVVPPVARRCGASDGACSIGSSACSCACSAIGACAVSAWGWSRRTAAVHSRSRRPAVSEPTPLAGRIDASASAGPQHLQRNVQAAEQRAARQLVALFRSFRDRGAVVVGIGYPRCKIVVHECGLLFMGTPRDQIASMRVNKTR